MIRSYHLKDDQGRVIATMSEPVTGKIEIFDRKTAHAIYIDKDQLINAVLHLQEDGLGHDR